MSRIVTPFSRSYSSPRYCSLFNFKDLSNFSMFDRDDAHSLEPPFLCPAAFQKQPDTKRPTKLFLRSEECPDNKLCNTDDWTDKLANAQQYLQQIFPKHNKNAYIIHKSNKYKINPKTIFSSRANSIRALVAELAWSGNSFLQAHRFGRKLWVRRAWDPFPQRGPE